MTTTEPTAVVFDYDGVLLNSMPSRIHRGTRTKHLRFRGRMQCSYAVAVVMNYII